MKVRSHAMRTEDALQKQIVRWLRGEGHLVHHAKNEGARTMAQVTYEKAMGMTPGMPDLLVLDIGLAIECKSMRGRVKSRQEIILMWLRRAGWTAGVARSLDDAQALCAEATRGEK